MIEFEKRFLYTFADIEEAKKLIGVKGLFFDIPLSQNELEKTSLERLIEFSPESAVPFEFDIKNEYGHIERLSTTFFYCDPNLQAKRGYYLENKQIQCRLKGDVVWKDFASNASPSWLDEYEYRIKPETESRNDSPKEDHRKYNIGDSDYNQYLYQVWDIWRDFNLNPWEADIVKRVLRHKKGEENDLKKINHTLNEMMSQTNNEVKKLHELFERIKDEYKLNPSTSDWLERFLLYKKREELLTLNNLYLKTNELEK